MNEQQHPDGVWHTTEYLYRDRKIMIKSKRNSGMKAHVFIEGSTEKVDFTIRYNFVKPATLIEKCKNKIDKKYPIAALNTKTDKQ